MKQQITPRTTRTAQDHRDDRVVDFDDSDDSPPFFSRQAAEQLNTMPSSPPRRLYPNIQRGNAVPEEKISENAYEYDEYTDDEVYDEDGRSVGGTAHLPVFRNRDSFDDAGFGFLSRDWERSTHLR